MESGGGGGEWKWRWRVEVESGGGGWRVEHAKVNLFEAPKA